MQFPITIGLRRSFLVDGILLVLGVLAAWAILVLPVSPLIVAGLLLLLCLLLLVGWRSLRPSVKALRLTREGGIQVCFHAHGHDFLVARLLPGANVHPWLTTLALEDEQGVRHRLCLAPDSLAADDFRRLRVFLRWRLVSGADDAV